ncbi:MAG: type II secretion system protein [Campylobacterales bacterium]|nr:type II secretion system protein [Campylobacterales bacterium]
MRRALTMIELVFVIVVIGILSAVLIPRMERDSLREAALQVASHIRYTQHLAIVDDKYIPDTSFSDEPAVKIANCQGDPTINTRDECHARYWYLGRWTIRFYENLSFESGSSGCSDDDYPNVWSYSIFSDQVAFTGNPDLSEMARNPINPNQFLSGGYNNILCVDNKDKSDDAQSMAEMRLGMKFDIKDIDFSGGCRSNVRYVSFDHLGRPFNSFPNNGLPYQIGTGGWHRLISSQCQITLCSVGDCNSAGSEEKVTIAIEPETGYVHILN